MSAHSTPVLFASVGDDDAFGTAIQPFLQQAWLDRDLSWLDFNDRVLAEALDDRTPLLERAKFLAIYTSNLDEFFMKRMSVLRQGRTEEERDLLQKLRAKLQPSLLQQARCYREEI